MNPGAINLLPAKWRAIEVSLAVIVAVSFLGVALWLIGWRAWTAHDEASRLRAELARLASDQAQDRRSPSTASITAAPSAQQVAAVETAVRTLNTPWRDLFDMVEAATPSTIDLIALEPDAGTGQLALTAEAGSSDEMLAYVRRLKRDDLTAAAALTMHESVEGVGGTGRLRFRLLLHWRGAGGGS